MGLTSVAQASTIELDYQGGGAFGDPNWSQYTSIVLDGAEKNVWAGLFRMEDTSNGNEVLSWCVDLYNYLTRPTAYEITSWFAEGIVENVGKLFNTAYSSVDSASEAAGFQLALWEIVTEVDGTALDFDSGNFRLNGTGAHYTLAQTYLSGLDGVQTGNFDLTFYEANGLSQDLVSGTPSAVPLPAAGGMLIAGLGAFGALRKRRKA